MKRHIKFPSIEQYRTAVQNVQRQASFMGLDADGNAIYNRAPDYPKVEAVATEKIHGTNAGVSFGNEDGFWVQSKENIIGEDGSDNAACAFHAKALEAQWMGIIRALAKEHNINLDEKIITVYYEWAGAGIQKNTALDGFGKRAMIFAHFKVSPKEPSEDEASVWFPTTIGGIPVSNEPAEIYNILDFPTWKFTIDFSPANALFAQNEMIELVAKIEASSPVGEQFGKTGNIGEGIVVAFLYKGTLIQFKVKGSLHAGTSKVTVLKKVDDARLQLINDIAAQVTPAWRLDQMFTEANNLNNGGTPSMTNMGTYMQLVNRDIVKEEADTIRNAGLEPKDIFKVVPIIARKYFADKMDELAFKA